MTPEQLRTAYLQHLTKEPPKDAGNHPSMDMQEQVGDIWARWERLRKALVDLLAEALVDQFLAETTNVTP